MIEMVCSSGAASVEALRSFEQELGKTLPADYRDFLKSCPRL